MNVSEREKTKMGKQTNNISNSEPWHVVFIILLPARASEQGNVIGLVSVYIYIYTVPAKSNATVKKLYQIHHS